MKIILANKGSLRIVLKYSNCCKLCALLRKWSQPYTVRYCLKKKNGRFNRGKLLVKSEKNRFTMSLVGFYVDIFYIVILYDLEYFMFIHFYLSISCKEYELYQQSLYVLKETRTGKSIMKVSIRNLRNNNFKLHKYQKYL